MARVYLQLYIQPGEAQIFTNIRDRNGQHIRVNATVDTGAAVTLLPSYLQQWVAYRIIGKGTINIQQAGIANQAFQAVTAEVTVFFEDQFGNRTSEFDIPVWFAQTDLMLIGWESILDRATLYIEMGQTRQGWIEI